MRFIDQEQSGEEIVAAGHDADTVQRIARLVLVNEFKRRQSAPGPEGHPPRIRARTALPDQFGVESPVSRQRVSGQRTMEPGRSVASTAHQRVRDSRLDLEQTGSIRPIISPSLPLNRSPLPLTAPFTAHRSPPTHGLRRESGGADCWGSWASLPGRLDRGGPGS